MGAMTNRLYYGDNLDVLRREVSMVLQKNVLFSGTILDNLRWGDENASEEECIRVAKLGKSSVRYEVGLFAQGEPLTAAAGHFVHVYVDRHTRRPAQIPQALRQVLEPLLRG